MSEKNVSDLSFEDAIGELEQIVSALEQGNVALERSIAIYERGEVLKNHCQKLLKEAESKVEKIKLSADGEPKGVEPLDPQ